MTRITSDPTGNDLYDVAVIGGGAAGLAGAVALGRARRAVVLIDAGEPRNATAGHIHNYLGREGMSPSELLVTGRREAQQYGVQIMDDRVLDAAKQEDGTFVLSTGEGTLRARRLLVTTGLVDELPNVPGLAERWGRTVLHCPYCHGWEVRDRAIGVLGSGPAAYHQALLFRQWSADITVFVHDAPAPTSSEAEQLTARGIRVLDVRVAAWEDDGAKLESGTLVTCDALVVAPRFTARTELLEALGLAPTVIEVDGYVVGTHVAASPTGLTELPGVWAAGNVANLRAQVVPSAAAGLDAAADINADLIREDTEQAVAVHRQFGAPAWDERYRGADGTLWSGDPNPVLVTEVSGLAPGSALDVGCGEGADALWLAARGWQVTGADISAVALERAAEHARQQGLDVEWRRVDLRDDPPAAHSYDLVTAHFMHLPRTERVELYANLAAAVRPGGTLLLVAHDSSDMHEAMSHWNVPGMFFTAEELVAELDPDDWEVLVAEARPRLTVDQDGDSTTIHDAVLRARRR